MFQVTTWTSQGWLFPHNLFPFPLTEEQSAALPLL